MADRDLAAKSQRFRAARDVLDLRDAGQAAIMQVNVDADSPPLGDAEDDVEMSVDVAIVPPGIEPADQVRAGADGFVEQLGRAWRGQDAALRKGDDLNRNLVAVRVSCRQD